MSAIAKKVIGEDDEMLRRIAMSGLPQDKLRMIKVKRALENSPVAARLGYGKITIRQSVDITTALNPGGGVVDWDIYIDTWINGPQPHRDVADELIKASVKRAFADAGYPDDIAEIVALLHTVNNQGVVSVARAEIKVRKLGKFEGSLQPDNTFRPETWI